MSLPGLDVDSGMALIAAIAEDHPWTREEDHDGDNGATASSSCVSL
jgi:hypothetical protein